MNWCCLLLILLLLAIVVVVIISTVRLGGFIGTIVDAQTNPGITFTVIPYPESVPPIPAPQTYDKTLAQLGLSTVMSNSNLDKNVDPLFPDYLKLIQTLPYNQGIVVQPKSQNGFTHILTFKEIIGLRDIVDDLKFSQVPYHGLGKVNAGFASVANQIYPLLKFSAGARILVTGHSLGAAVGELIAARLIKEQNLSVVVYISGRPRVGDLDWETNANKYLINRWILINTADDIPQLPLNTMRSRNGTGYGYVSSSRDRTVIFDYQTGNVSNNHSLLTYQYALNPIEPPFPTLWNAPLRFVCN